MTGLTPALLERACRIFLQLAYPEGNRSVPPPEVLLASPLCQPLPAGGDARPGYALRLGSALHPHLKLQIVDHADAGCVFSVDTHDAFRLDARASDAHRWSEFQKSNRQLKERIERAWEEAGLLTFNALLRRELEKK